VLYSQEVKVAIVVRTRRIPAARTKGTDGQKRHGDAGIAFVLAHYVSEGVEELDEEKLGPLLKLKYNNAIADALADLGPADQVRAAFLGFQQYLYQN
jgi:type I restriction enzyme R subunit